MVRMLNNSFAFKLILGKYTSTNKVGYTSQEFFLNICFFNYLFIRTVAIVVISSKLISRLLILYQRLIAFYTGTVVCVS